MQLGLVTRQGEENVDCAGKDDQGGGQNVAGGRSRNDDRRNTETVKVIDRIGEVKVKQKESAVN